VFIAFPPIDDDPPILNQRALSDESNRLRNNPRVQTRLQSIFTGFDYPRLGSSQGGEKMTRSIRSLAVLAAALAAAMAATPALAVPNFRMPTDSRIDLVRDLPNDATFERDGQYYDLGYLYSTERVNGADVARTGQGFVLYHDDRYIKLGPEDLYTVTSALGEDPTKDYVPPVATRAGQVARDGDGAPVAGQPIPYRSPTRRGSSGLGFIAAIVVVGFFAVLRFMMRSALRAMLSPLFRRPARRTFAEVDPFESRVSARLAELESGGIAPAYQPQPAMTAPAPRGFGRKGV
jgi:hypothetical protein